MNGVTSALTRKFGPLPFWAWALIGGAGLYLVRRRGASPAALPSDSGSPSRLYYFETRSSTYTPPAPAPAGGPRSTPKRSGRGPRLLGPPIGRPRPTSRDPRLLGPPIHGGGGGITTRGSFDRRGSSERPNVSATAEPSPLIRSGAVQGAGARGSVLA